MRECAFSVSMVEEQQNPKQIRLMSLALTLVDFSWITVIVELWKLIRKIIQGMTSEGVYEVLDYDSTLEIHDLKGEKATFLKQKRIRYLQDNIIAYQDYAWGDGEILLNYRSSRGFPVDRYRSGYKTYVLLSLREVKNRGDIDEFNIRWNIRKGFLTKDGYWATDVSNRTKMLKVNVVFPKSRPPTRLSIEESNRKHSRMLESDAIRQLPDGRWRISWQTNNPKLFEIYVLRWIW